MKYLKQLIYIWILFSLIGCPPQNNEIIQEPGGGEFLNFTSLNSANKNIYLISTQIYPSPFLLDSTEVSVNGNYIFNKGLPRIYEKEASCNGDLTPGEMEVFTILYPYNNLDTLIITFHDFTYPLNENGNYIHNADTIISMEEVKYDETSKLWKIPTIPLLDNVEKD